MKLLARTAVFAFFMAAAAAPASAQSTGDVRCLIVSNLFAKMSKDPKQKAIAEMSKFYYLGRLHGRIAPAQLQAQAVAQAKTLTQANAGPAMTACARQLQAGARSVETTLAAIARKKK